MDLVELRRRIDEKAQEGLIVAVLQKAARVHKKNWRDCDCRWCRLKQTATAVIANVRCGDRVLRADKRWFRAQEFRALLKQEESEL